MRILFVTPYVPSLVRIRPFNFIKYLAQRHEVSVLALQQDEREAEHIPILRPYCERIETIYLPKWRSFLNCVSALPTDVPLQGAYCYSSALSRRLTHLLNESHYDVVHVEHLRGAYLARSLAAVPRVYDSVDCISLLIERAAGNGKSILSNLARCLELPRTRRYEATTVRAFDRVIVTSRDDRTALRRLKGGTAGDRIRIIPNGVHMAYPPNAVVQREAAEIVFSGKMSYHANVDAVRYFCREVLPVVRAMRPGVVFTIVGSNPSRDVQMLAEDGHVQITGHVPDIRPYLLRAAVAVVPIRYAVGIQNKVLEAMAMGTPVVASSTACRALAAGAGADFLEADTAVEFAAQIIRLLDDPSLREEIGANGRRYVEANHEWSTIVARLSAVYDEVIEERYRQRNGMDHTRCVAEGM